MKTLIIYSTKHGTADRHWCRGNTSYTEFRKKK